MAHRRAALVPLAGAALLLAACGGGGEAEPAAEGDGTRVLTVFAAASLTDTFTELEQTFEAQHEGVDVQLSFAGSSDLAAQIQQGAPADVFASADEKNMVKVTDAGLVSGEPVAFASNTLTIVTAPGNPEGIASFADLQRDGLLVVTCAPQVPCGSATQKVEEGTGVELSPVSEESAVTDVLGKVTSGQADAGLVYVTDAAGAGDAVTEVPFPESSNAVNVYPIATLSDAADAELAQQFVDLVNGSEGRAVLDEAGFAAP